MNLSARTTHSRGGVLAKGKESTGRRSAEVSKCLPLGTKDRRQGGADCESCNLDPPDGIAGLVEVKPSLAPARNRSRRRVKRSKIIPSSCWLGGRTDCLVVGRARKQVARSAYQQRSAQKKSRREANKKNAGKQLIKQKETEDKPAKETPT